MTWKQARQKMTFQASWNQKANIHGSQNRWNSQMATPRSQKAPAAKSVALKIKFLLDHAPLSQINLMCQFSNWTPLAYRVPTPIWKRTLSMARNIAQVPRGSPLQRDSTWRTWLPNHYLKWPLDFANVSQHLSAIIHHLFLPIFANVNTSKL